MQVATIGLDLAKDVFQVHGISESGEVAFNRTIKRKDLLKFFDRLPRCVVGMEACGSYCGAMTRTHGRGFPARS